MLDSAAERDCRECRSRCAPAWRVTMLEPVHKKAAFMTQAIAELAVEAQRRPTRRGLRAGSPSMAISRAFADLVIRGERRAPRSARFRMKGVHPDEELRELPPAFEGRERSAASVPGVDGARVFS